MRADGQLAAGARRLRFTEHLALEGIAPSIGSVGDAYDNSLMETIVGLYKAECLPQGPLPHRPVEDHQRRRVRHHAWLDWWNNDRLHSTPGYAPPAEFDTAHHRQAVTNQLTRLPHGTGRESGTGQRNRRCVRDRKGKLRSIVPPIQSSAGGGTACCRFDSAR
jgi:hypothetical protein